MMRNHRGFTLVELMVALALGLIVTAAAIMLFITGQQNYMMQRGAADIQDNANFGLSYITRNIRLANLNASSAAVDDSKLYGGLVLSVNNVPATIPAGTLNGLMTQASAVASNVQDTAGTDLQSDQLTIQYLPVEVGGFDCEGQAITATDQVIVERYFLRNDTNIANNEPNAPLALACDAGRYPVGSPSAITGLSLTNNNSQIIMKRIDYFHVLLQVQSTTGVRRYMSIQEYQNITTTPKPRILAVQLGLLSRALDSAGQSPQIDNGRNFVILDQTVHAKVAQSGTARYLRQPLMQTVALRNALGDRI